MPVLVVRLEPWLAAQSFLGEPVPDRWRRIGAEAGFEVRIGGADATDGDAVVDGRCLRLQVEELRALGAGEALVLVADEDWREEMIVLGDDRARSLGVEDTHPDDRLVVAAPRDRASLVGTHDGIGPMRGVCVSDPCRPLRRPLELRAWERGDLISRLNRERDAGVRLIGDGLFLSPTVVLEPGCTLGPNVVLLGTTRVAAGAVVQAGCHLVDTDVGPGALVKPYVVAEGARIGPNVQVGPFAHLREGTVLEDGARIGNFVETKKARLGAGAKANHLAYLGDADVGAGANIGAGTITCNYDGARKHRTTIGAGAFVGTNSSLVAPVSIGADALIAAGSVITRDVPDGGLAVARGDQRTTPEKGRAILARNRAAKAAEAPKPE